MINESIPAIAEPVATTISSIFGMISAGIGGLFGLYVILVILRWKEARDLKKLLTSVRDEIKDLNSKFPNKAKIKVESAEPKKTSKKK